MIKFSWSLTWKRNSHSPFGTSILPVSLISPAKIIQTLAVVVLPPSCFPVTMTTLYVIAEWRKKARSKLERYKLWGITNTVKVKLQVIPECACKVLYGAQWHSISVHETINILKFCPLSATLKLCASWVTCGWADISNFNNSWSNSPWINHVSVFCPHDDTRYLTKHVDSVQGLNIINNSRNFAQFDSVLGLEQTTRTWNLVQSS